MRMSVSVLTATAMSVMNLTLCRLVPRGRGSTAAHSNGTDGFGTGMMLEEVARWLLSFE